MMKANREEIEVTSRRNASRSQTALQRIDRFVPLTAPAERNPQCVEIGRFARFVAQCPARQFDPLVRLSQRQRRHDVIPRQSVTKLSLALVLRPDRGERRRCVRDGSRIVVRRDIRRRSPN